MKIHQEFAARRPPDNTIRDHVGRTLRLALPVMVARAGLLVLVAVDTAMTGHAGAVELAHYGLAQAPQLPMMLVGIGLLMGTVVLTAQAEGAGTPAESGAVWRVALLHAVVLGVGFMVLCQAGAWFLILVGQTPELARGAGNVLVMFGWSLPAMMLYVATTYFLEGINRVLPGMFIMLAANGLNVALNWLFIFGHWGASAMGAEGAALATSIVRWFMFVAIAGYVLTRVDRRRYGVLGSIVDVRGLSRRLRRIGYPLGLSHGLETSAFAAMTLFAGLLGPAQIAGYQVAMNLVALVFMFALGFSTTASVRVGNAVGRRDSEAMARAGWVALGLATLVMVVFAVIYRSLPGLLAGVYTDDIAVAAVAIPTIGIAALVLIFDGTQGVLMGALRGAADVWPATFLYLVSFWLLMVPIGYVFGVLRGGGAPALMTAVGIGSAAAAVMLAVRFRAISRRAISRV